MYHTFNEKGETSFPTDIELIENLNRGTEPVLILDSCVCLELVKFADYKNKANVDKKKIIHFLDYIHSKKVETICFLGLLELCHDPISMTFNENKFVDFKNRIDFLELIPLKYIHSCQFDFQRDYHINSKISFDTNSISAFNPLIMTTYCCLLKIRELSKKGLKQVDAKRNIESFLEWSEIELDRLMGIECQLAMNIFGGVSEFRSMIWLDGKEHEIKRRLWATAWDIFHSRLSCNNLKLSKFIGKNLNCTFVTNDFNLFNLASQLSLTAIFENSEKGISTSMLMGAFEFKHFDFDYVDKLNAKSLDLLSKRVNTKKDFNEDKLVKMIIELEKQNYVA